MHLLSNRLNEIKKQHLTRKLIHTNGIDMISNDYLGFAQDKILQNRFLQRLSEIPLGATASRLLGGNLAIYEETEYLLAKFVNRQTALIFPSGYQANIALLSAILKPDDMVFSDQYNHASIIDGIRLTKAKKVIFPHRNYQALKESLKTYTRSKHLKIIISESLFSMDGTLADINELVQLATQFNALLIIDEAHSTGIWGASLVTTLGFTNEVFATIHTAGKALGASGAWIAGNELLKKYLINFARPFIFSTAPIPALLILLQEAIKHFHLVGKYRANIILFRAQQMKKWLSQYIADNIHGPILPIILNNNEFTLQLSHSLIDKYWHIPAIRPPTVPINSARLRITIKWSNSLKKLKKFAIDLQKTISAINT